MNAQFAAFAEWEEEDFVGMSITGQSAFKFIIISTQYHYHHGQSGRQDSCSIDLSPLSSLHRHNNNLTLLQVLHRAIHHRHPRCPRARHSRHTRGARRQSGAPFRAATSNATNADSKSRETGAAFASALPPRPATCSVSFALSNLHGFLRARPVEG